MLMYVCTAHFEALNYAHVSKQRLINPPILSKLSPSLFRDLCSTATS